MNEILEPDDDIQRSLAAHREIQQLIPGAWSAFFARFGRLTPIQMAVIRPIFEGKSVLVSAPTAGGKTEAVIAPLGERIVRQCWPGLSVLLITPTRALVNDLYARLEVPCLDMGVNLGRKTADHSALRRTPDNLLVTTPESLESMLTFHKTVLSRLRAVVVDEIHLLDDSPRGDQLRLLLRRLRTYVSHTNPEPDFSLQVVAMSATVPDAARTARAYVGGDADLIQASGQRPLDARIVVAAGGERERAAEAMRTAALFAGVSKVLVFVNSRQQVDSGADWFRSGPFADARVFSHHGSLSKTEREDAEAGFKSARRAVCVATPTLEVGIDIGDVDLVVCMDAPFSLASFLQRLGRGGRRGAGVTRVLCVARDRTGELLFEGLIRQSRIGLPRTPALPFRRSVLVQQALAYLRQVENSARTLEQFERVFVSDAAPEIRRDLVRSVLSDMEASGLLARTGNTYRPGSAGRDFIESVRIYSNIASTPGGVTVVDADSGKVVARAGQIRTENGVRVGGRSYEILPGGTDSVIPVRAGGEHSVAPLYRTSSLPYAPDVGVAVAGALGIDRDRLLVVDDGETAFVMTWLGRLANAILAKALSLSGPPAKESSFAIKIESGVGGSILERLALATDELRRQNPLGSMKIERLADLGPHTSLLTEDGLRATREDWLDLTSLEEWTKGIRVVEVLEPDHPRAVDLRGLASL